MQALYLHPYPANHIAIHSNAAAHMRSSSRPADSTRYFGGISCPLATAPEPPPPTPPQACNRMSMQCVPLYDSLGENAIEYIVNHSEAVSGHLHRCSIQRRGPRRASTQRVGTPAPCNGGAM